MLTDIKPVGINWFYNWIENSTQTKIQLPNPTQPFIKHFKIPKEHVKNFKNQNLKFDYYLHRLELVMFKIVKYYIQSF